jgi:hypothetical protein
VDFDRDVLALDEARFLQALAEARAAEYLQTRDARRTFPWCSKEVRRNIKMPPATANH